MSAFLHTLYLAYPLTNKLALCLTPESGTQGSEFVLYSVILISHVHMAEDFYMGDLLSKTKTLKFVIKVSIRIDGFIECHILIYSLF